MRAKFTSVYQFTKTGHRQYDVFLDIADADKVYHRTFVGSVVWTDGDGRRYSRGWTTIPAHDPYPNITQYEQKRGRLSTVTSREEAAQYCASCWFIGRSKAQEAQS